MAKKKFDYFKAFEQQTDMAVKEAEILKDVIENFDKASMVYGPIKKAHEIEQEADTINHAILNNIAQDFITPLDREDLVMLSHTHDSIIDEIEDVIQLFYIYDVHVMREDAIKFAEYILESCKALKKCAQEFPNFKKTKNFSQCIVAVNDVEDKADVLYIESTRKLFVEQKKDPMRVIVWARIFDRMEKCCDACEHAADIFSMAVLKNS